MERRTFIAALAVVPTAAVLAACGSDDADESLAPSDSGAKAGTDPASATTPRTASSQPGSTDLVAEPSDAGADIAVLSYTESGGFTTREFAFQDPPLVLITGDGRFITSAPAVAKFPGPLLPAHFVQSINVTAVDNIVAAADRAGLLEDVTYDRNDLVTDAATATLTIEADESTYRHEAYALGINEGLGTETLATSGDRKALLDFVTALVQDPESLADSGNLGEPEPWQPTAYQMIAEPVSDLSSYDTEPTIEPWPSDTGIVLADAGECTEASADDVGGVLVGADQLTFFTENDVTYQVIARPAYPGRDCT